MSDPLLDLQKYPAANFLLKSLPISVPKEIPRAKGAWKNLPLLDQQIFVAGDSAIANELVSLLCKRGANLETKAEPNEAAAKIWAESCEAWSRTFTCGGEDKLDVIALDGSFLQTPSDLKKLREELQHPISRLRTGGRVVLCAPPIDRAKNALHAAALGALDGFVRSLAKELGRRAARANLIWIDESDLALLDMPFSFFASTHSAFVTTQNVHVRDLALDSKMSKDSYKLEPSSLRGKRVLVTGAARGIGAECAKRLALEGAEVIGLDRPSEEKTLKKSMNACGGQALLVDIVDEQAGEKIATFFENSGLDVVVHNAGVTRDKTFKKVSQQAWDMVIDVNLAKLIAIDEVLRQRVLNEGGRLIYLSSVSGIAGNAGQTNYAATKSGLLSYMQRVALQEAQRGITANAIAPGFIETQMTAKMPMAIREAARRLSALGQGGKPQDIAEAVTFFALPATQGVSGETLRVCGGALVGR